LWTRGFGGFWIENSICPWVLVQKTNEKSGVIWGANYLLRSWIRNFGGLLALNFEKTLFINFPSWLLIAKNLFVEFYFFSGCCHILNIYCYNCKGQLWRECYLAFKFSLVTSFSRYFFVEICFWKTKMTFESCLHDLSILILWHIVSLST
jgi:hypothetical protein